MAALRNTRNLTETACHTPVRSRTAELRTLTYVLTPITVLFVILRLSYKHFFCAPLPLTYRDFVASPLRVTRKHLSSASRHVHSEEWTFIATIVVGLAALAIILFGITANGMGTDVWGLDLPTLVAFRRYFVVVQVCYVVLMFLLKTTCALFFLDIFFGRRIRAVIWGTVIVHVAITTVCVIVIIFQCVPIHYQWDKFYHINDDAVTGICININAVAWVNSTFSVASDLWLLAIPLTQLHKLNLHWKKKAGAALMFMTGATVTVVSCLRLASVQYYASTSNPTWDQFDIMYWSTVEIEVGFICSTLPAVRLLLVRFAPRVFGSAASNQHGTEGFEDKEASQTRHLLSSVAASSETTLKHPEAVLYHPRQESMSGRSESNNESLEAPATGQQLPPAKLPDSLRSTSDEQVVETPIFIWGVRAAMGRDSRRAASCCWAGICAAGPLVTTVLLVSAIGQLVHAQLVVPPGLPSIADNFRLRVHATNPNSTLAAQIKNWTLAAASGPDGNTCNIATVLVPDDQASLAFHLFVAPNTNTISSSHRGGVLTLKEQGMEGQGRPYRALWLGCNVTAFSEVGMAFRPHGSAPLLISTRDSVDSRFYACPRHGNGNEDAVGLFYRRARRGEPLYDGCADVELLLECATGLGATGTGATDPVPCCARVRNGGCWAE
ncbi:hypothetical protein ISF_01405 [Cordyceps fumosorosea ARSEF 2679]|uniref:Integral membrane protein n=1 Tax=Cordyceps fumosorosea (strain ARSEF 2679) TaxID=1081104 RepID=A0A162JQL1_CORFA|nr:hypothetical protein ISF_01405 [Cordyceps fumosorosea ARSEF 2679]OAA72332.1 hypothetical protein ISF_01405 [Cordyceps fumosorosea ARSEF 2679]